MIKQQLIEDLSLRLNEPKWRLEQRLAAFQALESLPFPKMERMPVADWNLLDVNTDVYFAEAGNVYDFTDKHNQALIVQQEDQTIIEQMPVDLAEQGVIVTDLMTAFSEYADLIKPYYMTLVEPTAHKLAAYNSAYLTNGIFVYIPKNIQVKEPIEALFMQEKDAYSSFVKHVVIVAEEGAELTYIEHLSASSVNGNKRSGNMIVEIFAKANAKIEYAAIDETQASMDLYLERKAQVGPDASVNFAIGEMNHGPVAMNLDAELVGDGSSSNEYIVAISDDDQVQYVDTKVNHYGKHSVGDIMQRGVVLDSGDLRFNGIGHIYPPAKAAETEQESRLMMMTANGRGDANPMLLIDHDDVIAGHAASVGQLDVETLFYLRSRGLTEEDVIKMQTYAFLSPVMNAMPNKQIQEELFARLERKLG